MSLAFEHRYLSWADALAAAVAPRHPTWPMRWERRSHTRGDTPWYGTASMDDALVLARDGWHDAPWLPVAGRIADAVVGTVLLPDVTFRADGGECVDVGRYLAGEPYCFLAFVPTEVPRPIVHLIVNLAAHADVPAAAWAWRGLTMLALVEALEYAGQRVAIDVTRHARAVHSPMARARWTVPLKTAEQPLDRPRLAFALGHVSMNRRLGFAWAETTAGGAVLGENYGRGCPIPDRERGTDELHAPDLASGDWESPVAARAYLLTTLADAGVTLTDPDRLVFPST